MDRAGIQTAFLSVTNPGVWFTDDYDGERQGALALARDMFLVEADLKVRLYETV